MWRSTPERVRVLRQRYEETDQLMSSIAAEFEVGERTLGRMVKKEGWRKRSDRLDDLPMAVKLLKHAEALATPQGAELPALSPPLAKPAIDKPAIDRLEALVVKEIAAVEQARARVTDKRQLAKVSDNSARTLATLTQTLRTLQQMRTGKPIETETTDNDDDMPRDIDEFRHALARRIEALFASETDAGDADADSERANMDARG